MDKILIDMVKQPSLKKIIKQGKTEIINEYNEKIHLLQNRKGDERKLARWKRKAERLLEEVAVLRNIKPGTVCKMVLSRDKDCENILSKEGVSLEDKCCALLANHSTVRDAWAELSSSGNSCPVLNADSPAKKRKKSSRKKDHQEETAQRTEDLDGDSESSQKENRESCENLSSSALKRLCTVSEVSKNSVSLFEAKPAKRKKVFAKSRYSVEGKEHSKKAARIEENVPLVRKEHLMGEMAEMQNVDENADSLSTGKTFKGKKRRKRKLSEDLMSSNLPGITDFLKDQDDQESSEKENCDSRQNLAISSSCGAAPNRSLVDNKSSISDKNLELQSRKRKIAEDQRGEEKIKKLCLTKEKPSKKKKLLVNGNNLVEYSVESHDSSTSQLHEVMEFAENDEEENISKCPGEKVQETTSSKRKLSVPEQSATVTKKLCRKKKDSELGDRVKRQPKQKKKPATCKANLYKPDLLIRLMYQLDLSVLCSLRKSVNQHRYPSLTLAFGDPEIAKFSDVVVRYEGKSVHVCVESVDSFIPSYVGYSRLFAKTGCSIHSCFLSFVKHCISSPYALHSVECLVLYTPLGLDLDQKKELRQTPSRNFFPFRFRAIDVDERFVIKNFLCASNAHDGGFYQFSRNKTTREELFNRLKLSPSVLESIGKKFHEGFENEIKKAFLDKLVFAVDQPNREELNFIVRKEIKRGEEDFNYLKLRKRITSKLGKRRKCVSELIYEFNLLALFLHDILSPQKLLSVKFEGESCNSSNGFIINFKDKISYFTPHYSDRSIDYSQLFSFDETDAFSINHLFTLFVRKVELGMRYFILYTNAGMDLTEESELKNGESKDFCALKFDVLDVGKKKYKLFRNCSCIDGNYLYQFSKEDETRKMLLSLLKFSPSSEEANGLSDEKELKEQFLDKLVFAVNQPDWKRLNQIIRNETEDQSGVPYDCKELFEVALRWLESYEVGSIKKEMLEKLLSDVKSNRSSYLKVQVEDVRKEITFAKSIVGLDKTSAFYQFLHFLLRGEGKKCYEVLKREGIKLSNLSSILHFSGNHAVQSFKNLYNFFFDEEGNKTHCLKALERGGINIPCITRLLHSTKYYAVEALKDLYNLWFDQNGKKTKYLKNLEESGVNLNVISMILKGAGSGASKAFKDLCKLWLNKKGRTPRFKTLENAGIHLSQISLILQGARTNGPKVFKDLYDLWFDEKGNKKEYLKTIEKQGISLTNITTIIGKSGSHAAEAFKSVYNLWFDEQGNKNHCLKTLEREGIKLPGMCSIVCGAGKYVAEAFNNLFNVWFDEDGNKKHCLKTLEKRGIKLSAVCGVLGGAGKNAHIAFKGLYNLWFDEKGKRTKYLKNLEKEGINLEKILRILHGAAINAPKAFKEFYDSWFDEHGHKTQYLENLMEKGLNISSASEIFRRTRTKATTTFKDLYNLWFDKKGKRTRYLKNLEEVGIDLTTVSSILKGTGTSAPKIFKELYCLWFDDQGNKTQLVETLEKRGITLLEVSIILSKTGNNAPKVFIGLYDLWFDEEGKKTKCMKNLRKEGVSLPIVFRILKGSGSSALKTFKNLYGQWFDEQGNATQYLKTLKENNLKLFEVSSILWGAGRYAVTTFKALYNIWFNKKGERTHYLSDFEKIGGLSNVISILYGAGGKALKAFKSLHDAWFDERGNKTRCFEALEKKIGVPELSSILSEAGADAAKAFKGLYSVLFDRAGEKSLCSKNLKKEGVKISFVISILRGTGSNAPQALKDFYHLWFDEQGRKSQLLETLEGNGIDLIDVVGILSGAGSDATKAFKELHSLWFDEQGNKTKYVTDLEEQGMNLSDVSHVLSGAGSNASEAFKDFYRSYFDR